MKNEFSKMVGIKRNAIQESTLNKRQNEEKYIENKISGRTENPQWIIGANGICA